MDTRFLSATETDLNTAAALLKNGELVGIPTETVYGLAANALDNEAVSRIFVAKGRPQDNPLIVHIADVDVLPTLVTFIPEKAKQLAQAFWPGPLTMIFPKSAVIPPAVSAGLSTVAVRMPSHPIAQELIRRSGCSLAAPSANRSGSPSPTTAKRVMEDMDGRISAVVDGGPCEVGVESTVIDMTQDPPRLLRPGGVTLEMLRETIGEVAIDPAVTSELQEGQVASSPGMKYKHYAPKASVTILVGSQEAYVSFVNAHAAEDICALCFDEDLPLLHIKTISYGSRCDENEQAARLFDCLRQLDECGAQRVYAACPSTNGIGLAVYNRLLRAAGFEVIELE